MWVVRRRRRKRASSVTKDFIKNKEAARSLILARLEHFNKYYGFSWNRVAIRNQRSCWGSCSAKQNLNFSYKLLYLPNELRDYIIVHELCHLKELNHGPEFWKLVAEMLPNYKELIKELKSLERAGASVRNLVAYKEKRAVMTLS